MTARRPPAPVGTGRPIRTERPFVTGAMDIEAQPMLGDDLVKHPG
jgi:hypothetical protein